MPAIHYSKRKFLNAHLVWFKNSNYYIQLEEPAWYVFNKIVKKYKEETIASQFAERYSMPAEESLEFVKEIKQEVLRINEPSNYHLDLSKYPDLLRKKQFDPFALHHYRFNEVVIAFSFDSRLYEYYIDPLLCHLGTSPTDQVVPLFELYQYEDKIVFRLDAEVKGVWEKDETHLVKGTIFMHLINAIYGKADADWLMTVHASAVTDGHKTIVLPADPGSGKTTFAALLQKAGYQLISDDFVPISRDGFQAFPFPIAMSVKQGSVQLLSAIFPDLQHKPENYISDEKIVRYIFPDIQPKFFEKIYPVKEFVFIQYDENVDFELDELDALSALQLLLKQSWVSPQEGVAADLFDQLAKWRFFKLTYSDNARALEAFDELFSIDSESLSTSNPRSLSTSNPRSLSEVEGEIISTNNPRSLSEVEGEIISTNNTRSLSEVEEESISTNNTRSLSEVEGESISTNNTRSLSEVEGESIKE